LSCPVDTYEPSDKNGGSEDIYPASNDFG
jgi:hypothetical protein